VVDDDAEVDAWVRRALDYTATLPEKQPKSRKPGKPKAR
jgi:hypothetical protein